MSNWTSRLLDAPGPRYRAIAQELVKAIEGGELAPGSRLPTQRELAVRLGVSVQTVSQAYAEVERRGLVRGEVGRGTFVLEPGAEDEPRFVMDRRSEHLIDLSINRPVYDTVHRERAKAGLAALAAGGDLASMVVCRPIAGLESHRAAGAVWLRRRGLELPPEQVLITNGAAHGLLVALSALTTPGATIATEAIVDHGIIGLAGMLGLRLHGLVLDDEGIVPEALEAAAAAGEVKVVCATPTFSNPTAALMSDDRRRAVAEVARRHDLWIVEDDVYGELLDGGPPPLAAYAPERTCYVTSFTKSVMSGLRTGYLAAPPVLVPRLTRRIRTSSWMATPLISDLATLWIRDGTAAELVEWQRRALAGRHGAVAEILGDFALRSPLGALHAWLALPDPRRPEVVVAEARLAGIAITPAEIFTADRTQTTDAIRISLGAVPTEAQLRQGLRTIAQLLSHDVEPYYLGL